MKTKKIVKRQKITSGMDYPKRKILDLIRIFGLVVDLDRWDNEGMGYLRIESRTYSDVDCMILYKDHLEIEAGREEEFLKSQFQKFLMKIGEHEFKKKVRGLFSLDQGESIFNA